MEIQDIIKLMEAVTENGLTSFKIEENGFKLSIKKEKEIVSAAGIPQKQTEGTAGSYNQPASSVLTAAGEGIKESAAEEICSDKIVVSPLVGTFYHASSEDCPPFVKVGDCVKKGQTLGIIEAMKLMNEIECDYDGVVDAILVGNEDVVEYGQPLFRIR